MDTSEDPDELERQGRLRHEAYRTVRERSRGDDLEAIRAALECEYRASGVAGTRDQINLAAESIYNSYDPRHRIPFLIKGFKAIRAILRESEGPPWVQPPPGGYGKTSRSVWLSVLTSGSSGQVLDRIEADVVHDSELSFTFKAWLEYVPGDERHPNRVLVHVGNETLGELSTTASAQLADSLRRRQARHRYLWALGGARRDGQGGYHVYVYADVPR